MTQVRRRAPRLIVAALAAALVAPVLGTSGVASAADGGAIEAYWQARGGSGSSLGAPVSPLTCDSSGCERTFATGGVTWNPVLGAKAVGGELYGTWVTAGGRNGSLGLPTAEMDCTLRDAGCGQPFLKGAAYWSAASGTHVIRGAILTSWRARGAEDGPLGYPTSSEQPVTGGVRAAFQGGTVYWSPATGPRTVRTAILAHYESLEGPTALGFPVSDYEPLAGGGERVRFQRGHIYFTAGTGAHVVEGAVLGVYNAQGAQAGPLGYPLSAEEAVAGGVRARFQGGTVYRSGPTGARVVRGPVLTKYESFGGPAHLGFPVTDSGRTSDGRGTSVRLQRGAIFEAGSGGHVVEGAILARYRELGSSTGLLGYPDSDEQPAAGGVTASFERGNIYWSPTTGARMVTGAILGRYDGVGGPLNLGFPIADEGRTADGTGALVRLQRGVIYWSPRTGAHAVEGAVLARWRDLGLHAGSLGYPLAGEEPVGAGVRARFQGGTVYWSAATGPRVVKGAIRQAHEAGDKCIHAPLGFPTTDERSANGGAVSEFEAGAIYWSPGTGAHAVCGATLSRYQELGAESGSLGYPTSDPYHYPLGGVQTRFQKGYIHEEADGTTYWSR